jgi:16S rRNA (cytosine967-C5)-methyltransferase
MASRDPRRLALDALVRVEEGAFLDALVGETLARSQLAPRDAALFTRLAYGTVAWQLRIDWTAKPLLDRPWEKLDPPIRAAIRIGLHQLFGLDRVPAHAAVDATVRAVRTSTARGAAGFVNAVLRRAAREGERPLPARASDPASRLAIEWSHPEWLVRRWLAELGEERAIRRLAANNEAAPTVLRVDARAAPRDEVLERLRARGVDARPTAYARSGILLEGPLANLGADASAIGGGAIGSEIGLTPQGEASQLVVALLAPAAGERVLDACAAPGGKSAAAAEILAGSGRVIAADRSLGGVRRIHGQAVTRPGLHAVAADGTSPPWRDASFDAALVDAPCSGLGTLRGHPEIRWRRRPETLASLAELQGQLLAATAPLVRVGGGLVYATCTSTPEENEGVVTAFLRDHASWRRIDARDRLPPEAAELVSPLGALETSPEAGGLDGFYAVRLERES